MSMWIMEMMDGVVVVMYNNLLMNYFCVEGVQEFNKFIDEWWKLKYAVVIMIGAIFGKFIIYYSVEELVDMVSDWDKMWVMGIFFILGYHGMLLCMCSLFKFVIVVMNGDIMGGGFELILLCDIRIGQCGDYCFGLLEVKLGILFGGSGM